MKKTYQLLFTFCFAVISTGIIAMFISKYAVDFNFGLAAASSISDVEADFTADLKMAFIKSSGLVCVKDLKTGRETLAAEKFEVISSIKFNASRDKLIICGAYKGKNGVYIYEFNSKSLKTIIESGKKDRHFFYADINKNENFVCYAASKTGDPFAPSDLFSRSLENNSETNITAQNESAEVVFYYNYPQFSSDSKNIIYSKASIPDLDTPRYDAIYVCSRPLAGGTEEVLTGGAAVFNETGEASGFKASAPSPADSGCVAFLKTIGTVEKCLSVYDAVKKETNDITGLSENISRPVFTKNLKYAAFEQLNDEGGREISHVYLYEVSSRTMKKITAGRMPAL